MQSRSSWQIQKSVLHALLIRELKTRFGEYRLGLAWALLEPLMQMLFFMGMFYFRERNSVGGLALPVFLATGLVPFFYFNKVIAQSMGAVSSNQNLFIYRQVRVFDAFLSRFVLEASIAFITLAVILLGSAWFGIEVVVVNSLKFLLLFALLSIFSFGISLIFGVLNKLYPEAGKFLPVLLRPLFFISGAFFTINDMPSSLHPFLLWNPLLHIFELMRSCFATHYSTDLVSMRYVWIATLISITLGMLFYRANWRRMLVR